MHEDIIANRANFNSAIVGKKSLLQATDISYKIRCLSGIRVPFLGFLPVYVSAAVAHACAIIIPESKL